MLVLFVNGASASGKTSIVKNLALMFEANDMTCKVLAMDDYYRQRPEQVSAATYRETTNFDVPEALDLPLLTQHLELLNQGQKINKPIYSFEHCLYNGYEEMIPPQVLIVEGIFANHLRQHYAQTISPAFIVNIATDSYQNMLQHRIVRNARERAMSADIVRRHERLSVGPGFFKYTAGIAGVDLHILNKSVGAEKLVKALSGLAQEIYEEVHPLIQADCQNAHRQAI